MKNRDEVMTERFNMEIANSAPATKLDTLWLGYRKLLKDNESNFIDEFDELWIGDNAGWYKIVEF